MKKFLLLMFAMVMLLAVVGCGNQASPEDEDATQLLEMQEELIPADEETYAIESKYAALAFPAKWERLTAVETVSEDPYTIRFSYKTASAEVPVFELSFGGEDGFLLGMLTINGEAIPVNVNDSLFADAELNEADYLNCCAMEEDINTIISQLADDYEFQMNLPE